MIIGILILIFALAALIYGSYTDFKIREVPNWLSYSFIAVMLGLRIIDFIITGDVYTIFYAIVVGAMFLIFGYVMFYASQWGGADLKIMTAVGIGFGSRIPPFNPPFLGHWTFGLTLFMNILFMAAAWSLAYAFAISFRNKTVWKEAIGSMKLFEKIGVAAIFVIGLAVAAYDFFYVVIALCAIMWFVMKYMKSVEKNCLFRGRAWKDVVEFDVPVKNLLMRGKVLKSTKDPNGFTLEEIAQMKKLAKAGKIPKTISVKWGVPLTPAFPLAVLLTVFFGDIIYWVIQIFI